MANGNEAHTALKDKLNLHLPRKKQPQGEPGSTQENTPPVSGGSSLQDQAPKTPRQLTLDEQRLRQIIAQTRTLESGVDNRQNMVEGAGVLGATVGGATGGVLGKAYYNAGVNHPLADTLLSNLGSSKAKKARFAGSRWIPGIAMGVGAAAGGALATAGVRNAFRADTFNRTMGRRMAGLTDEEGEDYKNSTALAGGMAMGAGVGAAGRTLASRIAKRHFPDASIAKLTPKAVGKAALIGTGFGALRSMINRSIVSSGESARERLNI